jgi:hypothetical protein
MPLLDHFHPPLSDRRHWGAFHSRWASAISDHLNEQGLPEYFVAEPTVNIGGQVQVDVAMFEDAETPSKNGGTAVATLPQAVKTAAPAWVIPALFPDSFAVHVINTDGGPKLVAAIELVSPANKDRPQTRRAFAIKCANYLFQGIACIVIDVVTNRTANLHNEMMEVMQTGNYLLPDETSLYATAYRPVRRRGKEEIEAWHAPLALGTALPGLPLFVAVDLAVVVDFEATYQETCRRLRIAE